VPHPHAGSTEAEQRLEEAQQLRLQLQSLGGQLQAQVLEKERVSRLKGELEELLLALGQAARIPGSRRRMTKR
jgi:hypothetical protein